MKSLFYLLLIAATQAEEFTRGFHANVLAPFESHSISTMARTGVPSFKPSRFPTTAPTEAPSNAPTFSAGWLVKKSFKDSENCDSPADRVDAVRSGTCLRTYDDQQEQGEYWVKVECVGEVATVYWFYDSNCANASIADVGRQYSTGCQAGGVGTFAYTDVYCSESDSLPLSDFVSYTQLLGYDTNDDSCDEDNAVRLQAFQDNSCLSTGDDLDKSTTVIYPDIYVYTTSGSCNGSDFTVTTIENADVCVITEALFNGTDEFYEPEHAKTDLYAYYGTYYSEHNVLFGATDGSVMWSSHTGANPWLSFTAKQNVHGVLPTDFKDNMDANSLVWAHAVADTIGYGVSYENVEITELNLNVDSLRRRMEEASTDVTYKVTYDVRVANFDTASEANAALTAKLISRVENGTFTENMQMWNADLSSESSTGDLGDATSDDITVKYAGSASSDNDDGSEWADRASANVIAGVIIGIGGALIIAAVFFMVKGMSSS